MKKQFFNSIVFIFFLFISLFLHAQKIVVKASADKNKIFLGERFNLTIEATTSSKEAIHFWSIDDIPHFEIVSKEKIDTSKTNNGTTLKQIIQLTSFDSGHWYIPAFHWDKKAKTDSIPIDVVFSDFDPQKPYHDVKDIIEVNSEKQNPWLLYIIVVTVVVIGLIIFLLTRKKKPAIAEAKPIDSFKEAMLQLDKLEKGNIPLQNFYTELVNIFRLYIFRKKGIQSLQKTTDDLVLQLKNINMPKEQFDKLAEALRLSDAVKFAKYTPGAEETRLAFKNIKDSIQSIEQIK